MQPSTLKTVVIVAGPTASGKTSIAIELAKNLKTEIISADSRQCYRELDIGVARPSHSQLAEIKHHFIASHSILETVNAALFSDYALRISRELFAAKDTVVMVGGTGLYIKAFCEGLDVIPAIGAGIRERIQNEFDIKGLEWLQREVSTRDPLYYQQGEISNPRRLMRALEVIESTGSSILKFQSQNRSPREFRIIKVAVDIPMVQLDDQINRRVDEMMEKGLLQEVKQLLPFKTYQALQTVGYAELFSYLEDKLTLEEAIERIRINTRQYAKRQLTWFRKDSSIKWSQPDNIIKEALNMVRDYPG